MTEHSLPRLVWCQFYSIATFRKILILHHILIIELKIRITWNLYILLLAPKTLSVASPNLSPRITFSMALCQGRNNRKNWTVKTALRAKISTIWKKEFLLHSMSYEYIPKRLSQFWQKYIKIRGSYEFKTICNNS